MNKNDFLFKLYNFYDNQGKSLEFFKTIFHSEFESTASFLGGINRNTEYLFNQLFLQYSLDFILRTIRPTLKNISDLQILDKTTINDLAALLIELLKDIEQASKTLSPDSILSSFLRYIYSETKSCGTVLLFILNQILIPSLNSHREPLLSLSHRPMTELLYKADYDEPINSKEQKIVIIEIIIQYLYNLSRLCIGEEHEPFKEPWDELNSYLEDKYQQILMRSVRNFCGINIVL